MIWLLFALILALLMLRQSILVILLVAVLWCWWAWSGAPLRFAVLDAWDALNREVLLAIPLYLLAGRLMSSGSMASRLTDLLRELTRPVPGGLALAAVLACAVFAAISGSSTVTMVAVGGVMYPALLDAGYPRRLALGALCAAGTLGIVIPPSIPLILYGVMANVSIVDLFRAGVGPALVLLLLFALYVIAAGRSVRRERLAPRRLLESLRRSLLALLMPLLVLGGIYSGIFTATEAAAVAVAYTAVVQLFVFREMGVVDLLQAAGATARLIGSLFPVLMLAVCLNQYLGYQHLPDQAIGWLSSFVEDRLSFLLVFNVLLLLVGAFIDIGSAILLLTPLLTPVATGVGIDPVHLGVIMIVNLEIGYLTPPMGLNLIVAMGAFREDFREICLAVLPFIGLMLLALALTAAVPGLSLFLVR